MPKFLCPFSVLSGVLTKAMLPLISRCLSGHSSFFVLFIASLHIFAPFTIYTVHVDAAPFIDEAQEIDDSRDISIVHKLAQLHDAFTATLILCGGKNSVSTAHSLRQIESGLHASFLLHSLLAVFFFLMCNVDCLL